MTYFLFFIFLLAVAVSSRAAYSCYRLGMLWLAIVNAGLVVLNLACAILLATGGVS